MIGQRAAACALTGEDVLQTSVRHGFIGLRVREQRGRAASS
jgi:hypothetical protein